MADSLKLKALTLNCWALWVISKSRRQRMEALALELKKGNYDIVALEELWVRDDFDHIKEVCKEVLPYCHDFAGGMVGSGCAFFSRWPIVDIGYLRFTLNGFAHRLDHCDWYGGKLVGLAVIQKDNFRVNVYSTHMHALYAQSTERVNDTYNFHRMSQGFEMTEYIRLTSRDADLVVLMGDLNTDPVSLTYKVIEANGGLKDTWETRQNKYEKPQVPSEAAGATIEMRENSFTEDGHIHYRVYEHGAKIDYIMYRAGKNMTAQCLECRVALTEKIPGTTMNFSDHHAVEAVIEVRKREEERDESEEHAEIENNITILTDLFEQIQTSRIQGESSKKLNAAYVIIGFYILIIMFIGAFWLNSPVRATIASFVCCFGWCYVAYQLIFKYGEVNTLHNIEDCIALRKGILLKRLNEMKKDHQNGING